MKALKVTDRNEVVALVEALEVEMNNGGFDQFFFNDVGGRTAETIAALEAIGAVKTARIVKSAAALFPGGMPPKERATRRQLLERGASGPIEFHELDNRFYQFPEDLVELRGKFANSAK